MKTTAKVRGDLRRTLSPQVSSQARRFLPLCLLAIPLFLTFLFLINTNHLPESDGAGYLMYGHQVYTHFRDAGIADGLWALYWVRDFRPIVFNGFLVPFLIGTGGSFIWAYRLCILFIAAYTALYSFLLLREYVPRLSAAIGAAFVVSLPAFLYLSVDFYPEATTPGLVIGVIYHLLKSRDFSRIKQVIAAAALAAVAFCLRPEQMSIMLGPVLLLAAGIAYRKNLVTIRDVMLCAAVPTLCAVIFLFRLLLLAAPAITFPVTGAEGAASFLKVTNGFLMALMGILLLAIPVVFWKARKTRSTAYTLLGLSLLVSVLPLAWFFPFALRLYEWMFQAALGDGARSMHADFLPLTANLWALLQSSGSFVILAAAAILALSLLAREDFRRFLTVASDDRRRATAYLVVSMALPLGIIVLGSSVSPAFSASGQAWRRLLASFCVLILTCMLVGLRQGMPLRLLRVTALALLLTQSAVAAIRNGALDWPIARYKAFSGELEKPVRLIPEPNGQVIAALDRLALTEDVTRVNIEGYTDISAGALRLLANIQEKKYIVGNDYIPAYAGPQQVPELARRFSHIVIAMKPPLGDAPNEIQTRITEYRAKADANSHRQADILQFLSSGWLEHYGLQYVSRMQEARSEAFIFRSLLYGRTADGTPIATFPHADVEYITKKPPKGAVATATSSQAGFPVSNLIDGTPTPWGAVETADDTYFGLVFDTPRTVKEIRMVMFSSGGLQHLRDVSVVVSDAAQPNGANWRVIRSRLEGQKDFTEKVTVPPLPDQAVVRLEIDPSEPAPHRAWGLACLSKSKNYVRNYLQAGTGVYVRELEMK